MPGCCAFGCTNRPEKGFIMKVFPRDPVRRKQWAAMVKREGWSPTDASCLCEAHFEPHMWEKVREDGKRILKCNAVPTIFSDREPPKRRKLPITQKPHSPKKKKCAGREENTPCCNLPGIAVTGGMDDVGLHAIKREPEDLMENGEGDDSSTMSTVEEVHIKTEENEDMVLAEVKTEIPVTDIEIKDEVLEPSEWCEDENSCSSSSEKLTKCPYCDENYPDYSQMEYHIASLHPGKKRHFCFECNKLFRRHTDFINHTKTHQTSESHICPMCLKGFLKAGNLRRHVDLVHKDIKLLRCAVCRETFLTPSELQEHIFAHKRDERLFSCSKCSKMFKRRENMLRHMMTHSDERPHICPECKKGFKHNGQLKTHMRIHSDKKPKPCFTCDLCFQTFTKMYSLRRHQVFHTNEIPYLCSECGKVFKQKSALDYHHKSLHSTERLHLCHQCGMSFVSQSSLNKHVSVHHSGVNVEEPVEMVSSADPDV